MQRGGYDLKIEIDKSKSIYTQIIDGIKKSIIRGELEPGSQIPSQRDFAALVQVNPNTVQRAYREMERMGLVETLRGQGTFVCKREGLLEELKSEMAQNILCSFITEMRSLGYIDRDIIELIRRNLEKK